MRKLQVLLIVYEFAALAMKFGAEGGKIQDAVNFGTPEGNTTKDDCVWTMDTQPCSNLPISYTFYSVVNCETRCVVQKNNVDLTSPAWLHSSNWNPSHETVVLIHGYGGTDEDFLPMAVLRDAYLKSGTFNVIMANWGSLAKIPCYLSAVNNMKNAAKCFANLFTFLRNSGVDTDKTTCVGHSLGAHVCGIVANFINFRMKKIIALDPAKPFVPNLPKGKLDAGDAEMVQVFHTSSNYGDFKKMGHIDVYFNGGRNQPYCLKAPNEELCSHTRSACYLAEGLFQNLTRYATKCTRRSYKEEISRGILNKVNSPPFIAVGHHIPEGIEGSFCVSNVDAPYCKSGLVSDGSPYCCQPALQKTSNFRSEDKNVDIFSLVKNDLLGSF